MTANIIKILEKYNTNQFTYNVFNHKKKQACNGDIKGLKYLIRQKGFL